MQDPLVQRLTTVNANGNASGRQGGCTSDAHGKMKRFQVSEKLFVTADLAEFLTLISEFDAIEIAAPLIVERAISVTAAYDPELIVVQNDLVACLSHLILLSKTPTRRRVSRKTSRSSQRSPFLKSAESLSSRGI